MTLHSPASGPANSALNLDFEFAGKWPDPLRLWFNRLMANKAQKPPELPLPAWQFWLKSVEKHGLSSLIFSQLRTCESQIRPPAEIFAALRTAYFEEAARIMIRRTQLDNLLRWLDAAGIRPLILKGSALGETIYADRFQRPSADIDILVRKGDYETARTILLENGYRSKRGDRSLEMAWSCDEEFMPAVDEAARQYVVELHWALTSHADQLAKIDSDSLSARAEKVNGLNHNFRVLNPVDALVHASLHLFYKHITEPRLIWLYDIHLLACRIESLGLWYEAIAQSQQWQARLALQNCLNMARRWFDTPFPDEVNDPAFKPADLEETQLYNLVIYQLEHGRREAWLKKHLFQLKRLKGWDKFHYLKSRLFPTRQEIEANYPRLRLWPGPLVHIGRLAMMLVTKK
jgi:hypothetical protein